MGKTSVAMKSIGFNLLDAASIKTSTCPHPSRGINCLQHLLIEMSNYYISTSFSQNPGGSLFDLKGLKRLLIRCFALYQRSYQSKGR